MKFIQRSDVLPWFEGKSVAIVGSGPGCEKNPAGLIDSHDVVVRVNNYKLTGEGTGRRTDVYYSFFGTSIKKPKADLIADGVNLCMCKLPNAHAIESEWHRKNDKMIGVDYRPHYNRRKDWWFCDTYVPTINEFKESLKVLDYHMPTTGFAAIFEILRMSPSRVYITGFDFFRSKIHNVDEPWRFKNGDDPLRHMPEKEFEWLVKRMISADEPRIRVDETLGKHVDEVLYAAA